MFANIYANATNICSAPNKKLAANNYTITFPDCANSNCTFAADLDSSLQNVTNRTTKKQFNTYIFDVPIVQQPSSVVGCSQACIACVGRASGLDIALHGPDGKKDSHTFLGKDGSLISQSGYDVAQTAKGLGFKVTTFSIDYLTIGVLQNVCNISNYYIVVTSLVNGVRHSMVVTTLTTKVKGDLEKVTSIIVMDPALGEFRNLTSSKLTHTIYQYFTN